MLALTTVKRLTGLALPLVIGGSVLAVRAASATSATPAAAAACSTSTTDASTTVGGSTTTGGSSTTVGGATTTAGGATTTAGNPLTTLLPTTTTACTTTTTTNCPTTTTSGGTTSLPSTTTTGGSTTTSVGSTTTSAGSTTTSTGLTLPITLPGSTTTTTVGGSTTTTGGSTTTTGGSTTLLPGGSTTTSTTVCPTTTTTGQGTALRITSISTDNIAGHALTINGTAKSGRVVTVHGNDPKHGSRVLGETTSSHRHWRLHLKHGVLYNTVARATSGSAKSNTKTINVAQVLRINGRHGHCHYSSGKHCAITFLGESASGFRYRLTGSSASKVPHEKITVRRHGHVLGTAHMHSDGSYTITFTIKSGRSKGLTLSSSGRGNGHRYTLGGHRNFHVQ